MIVSLFAYVFRGKQAPVTGSATDTEYTAEVVRIEQVSPHPNADRLEIARFALRGSGLSGYEVVIQKGSFRPGDLAAYFSVDCILPTDHPEFKFLTERLDGKGKTYYRLRAARLRGVFSQGLLVPQPFEKNGLGFEFGRAVADHFGVSYYRGPSEDSTPGPTAATKKPKPQPMPVYGVDSLKKCPRLFEPNEPVVITEKIHGTNFRFGHVRANDFVSRCLRLVGKRRYRFVVGSHRVIKDGGSEGHWYGEDLWSEAAEKMGLREKASRYPGHVFYGELYGYTYSGKAIQDLTYGRKPTDGPGLAIFDVSGPKGWLSYPARTAVLHDTGLSGVPVLSVGELAGEGAEGIRRFAASGLKSTLDSKTVREGVVAETWFGGSVRKKAKFVGEDYLLLKQKDPTSVHYKEAA